MIDLIHRLPVESPNKMVAINAAAYLAGVLLDTNIFSSLSFYAVAAGSSLTGLRVLWLEPHKVKAQNAAHAYFILYSCFSGGMGYNLLYSVQVVNELALKVLANPNHETLLQGAWTLSIFLGFMYPLAKSVNLFWLSSLRSIEQWGVPAETLYDYAVVRKFVLTSETFPKLITIMSRIFGSLHETELIEKFQEQALNKITFEEFEQLLHLGFHSQLSQKRELFLSLVQPKIAAIFDFCNNLQTKIDQVDGPNRLEQLLAEMDVHSKNALKLRPFDSQLKEAYETYLSTEERNSYRAALKELVKKFLKSDEEEEDLFFYLPDIFREKDCHEYVKILGLKDIPGKSYTEIFNQELTRLGLATSNELKKMGGTLEEKKAALIEAVKKARGSQINLNTAGSQDHLKNIAFRVAMITLQTINIYYNPTSVLWGLGAGFIGAKINTVRQFLDIGIPFIEPNTEMFQHCTSLGACSRLTFFSILNCDPGLVGFKAGYYVEQKLPFWRI